jgi:UPF0755 protein
VKRAVLTIVVAVAAGTAVAGAAVTRYALSPLAGDEAPNALFVVSPGESLGDVARNLEDRELVRSAWVVEWLARSRGLASSLHAGEFVLSPSQSPGEILEWIARGRVATSPVVLPEGFTLAQIAQRLASAEVADREAFLALARDPETAAAMGVEGETLEGYLFPETYRIPRGLEPMEIARTLVAPFFEVWREIEPAAREQGLSMREVVTLASIVEKETAAPEERPLIAAVFRNRLERGMRLETDPTMIYGSENFDGNLRRRDLENVDNPHNTYRIFGLPPGTIASPGAEPLLRVAERRHPRLLEDVSGTHQRREPIPAPALPVSRHGRGPVGWPPSGSQAQAAGPISVARFPDSSRCRKWIRPASRAMERGGHPRAEPRERVSRERFP